MPVLGSKRSFFFWALAVSALLPGAGGAQLRTVVSNEIAVSAREATLRLEFEDREDLTISFRDGQVMVGEESLGTYTRGDALDLAWRSLLGRVLSLDDGPLADALHDWVPPDDLSGSQEALARKLSDTLGNALAPAPDAEHRAPTAEIHLSLSDESSLLGALLRRTEALQGLAEALEDASLDDFVLRIGEDLEVEAGEEVTQSVILVDGDLDLAGAIRGNVIVTDGSVRLLEGGLITGDLRVVDGEVESLGGEVEGEIILPSAREAPAVDASELRSLREDLEREVRRDLLESIGRETSRSSSSFWRPFRNVGRAIAGLIENLLTFLVLAVLGALIIHFGRERLEIVATTARRAPAQSAMVGLAGAFLLLPVWVLGIVALAVSIIGIPVLLAWVPLFPIAAGVAALLGYVAVARNVGEWVADQEYRGLEWIRGSNTFYVVTAGLAALMIPAVAASLVRILGLGLLQGLLGFLGSAIIFVAVAIGFGAVLLSRGGRIRPYAAYYDFEEEPWVEPDEGGVPSSPSTPDAEGPGPREGEPPSAGGTGEPEATGEKTGRAPGEEAPPGKGGQEEDRG